MIEDLPTLSSDPYRQDIRSAAAQTETEALEFLLPLARFSATSESTVWQRAHELVIGIRNKQKGQGGIDALLQEFSLSSEEGVVLMCLAEALLRIPDAATQDRMIQDRLGSGDWTAHFGQSDSMFVNASAWGLLLTGKVNGLSTEGNQNLLSKTVSQLGEPAIRSAMRYAMQIIGAQFVMGRDIGDAIQRARFSENLGYTYSYDMLGEGARTMVDADHYLDEYAVAIDAIGHQGGTGAGISVKLSALHPRYELKQHRRTREELIPRLLQLALAAKRYGIGLTVDAEESFRLDLSMEVIEAVFSNPKLAGWEGFGLAVQAYQMHGYKVVAWAIALAERVGRKLCVRLVKGDYWDSEIKWEQERGYERYPVFTLKSATDVSCQACSRLLMTNRELAYPQFATHNAYTLASVQQLELESDVSGGYEFQRLHGMGEELYDDLVAGGVQCRIYAPVGRHADLLAYLVRRLLENGANTSFVNNIQNREFLINVLLADPVVKSTTSKRPILLPRDIYKPHRSNSSGLDIEDIDVLGALDTASKVFWDSRQFEGEGRAVTNPAHPDEVVGHIEFDDATSMLDKLALVVSGQDEWQSVSGKQRSGLFLLLADRLEFERVALINLCLKETGKTLDDCIAEVREAIAFFSLLFRGEQSHK